MISPHVYCVGREVGGGSYLISSTMCTSGKVILV